MNNTAKLTQLLADHARLTSERARHEQMAVSLQAEETKLIDTVNLENKVEFEKVSQLRQRMEIVPRKIKSFQEATERTLVELADECLKATPALLDIICTKNAALTSEITKALEPFFPTKSDAADVAEQILPQTIKGAVLIGPVSRLKSGNFIDLEAIAKAKELLKLVPVVEAVEA
jgi:hypothetical protein